MRRSPGEGSRLTLTKLITLKVRNVNLLLAQCGVMLHVLLPRKMQLQALINVFILTQVALTPPQNTSHTIPF